MKVLAYTNTQNPPDKRHGGRGDGNGGGGGAGGGGARGGGGIDTKAGVQGDPW